MTTKTDDIKLPPLPVGFFKHHIAGFDGPVYAEMQMEAYARAAVESDRREYLDTLKLARAIVNGHRRDNPPEDSVEADRQSQPAISDMQLQCILQVYDDALDKAREGREFDNPGRPGSLEARAWDAGTRRGKELGPIGQPAATPAGSPAIAAGFGTFSFDDRFWHATDRTWWRRGDDGMLVRAEAPQTAVSEEPSESAVLLDALSGLVNVLRERHYGRMPDEVQAAYDKAWAIVFSSPVAVQAQPSAQDREDAKRYTWLRDHPPKDCQGGMRVRIWGESGDWTSISGEKLDAAIDAARAAKGADNG